ncbi:ComEC/Rec2 family competence protein [Patescibacteria group bacterium]|nr:ComEC/Rec2 family competence protein [Patescibacteria group bacterium]
MKEAMTILAERSLPLSEAGLLLGIVLGETKGIDYQFWQYLKNSGMLHLVVVSGANVILLTRVVVEGTAGFLGRKGAIAMGFLGIWIYAGLVGWQIPVLRASFLMFFYYLAQFWGRKYDLPRALALTVGIMIIIDWRVLWELSFWLSFLAFVAVVEARDWGEIRMRGAWFYKNVFLSLWVGLWLTPILAISFGQISIMGILVSGLLLGVIEIATFLGGIGLFIGWLWPVLGKLVLWLTYPFLVYLKVLAESFGQWQGLNLRFNRLMLGGWYLVLIYILLKRKIKRDLNKVVVIKG